MKQLMILIAAFTLYAACKKEKLTPHTTVSGQVVSEYDGRPVPNATVFLIKEERGCLGNMGCAKQVMTTQADSDGKYSFSFDWVNDNFYSVDARDEASGWYKSVVMEQIRNMGKTNSANVRMTPYGITPIRIKNVRHNSKYIRISNLYKNFEGENLDTIVYMANLVLKNHSYSVVGGGQLAGHDSGFSIHFNAPPPVDTAKQVVEIFY